MISFQAVRRIYGTQLVLDRISFDVAKGEFITLFGPNGCGKSTLMNILSGVDQPSAGQIAGIESIKGQIGFVFQDYRRTLLPWRSGAKNIRLPLQLRGIPKKQQKVMLAALIEKLKPDFDLKQPIFTLSGGQAQMIGLMRALIIQPKLLILDEPFSALDYARTLAWRQTIIHVARDFDLTTLFISHDLDEALYLGDRVVFLTNKPTQVKDILSVPFARPRNPDLLGTAEFAAQKLKALHIFQTCS
jgi:NitT/TauT family transport system ATP-binding protein